MASERFKFFIGGEPPKPEEKREYTKKEKAKNFWHYNKWYFICGAIAIIAVVGTIISVVTKVKPDYTFGLISAETLPETLTEALEKALATYADDRNGDGKTVVSVSQFNISYVENDSAFEDPNIRMANITRLLGDFQANDSMIFFVDDLQSAQEKDGFFAYNDGTIPPEDAEVDYSKMGVRWAESSALAELPIGPVEIWGLNDAAQYPDGQQFMQSFTMVMRVYDPTVKPESKSTQYYLKSREIFEKLSR